MSNIENLPAPAQAQAGDSNQMIGTADMLFVPGMMEKLEHFAVQMSKGSATIPDHLRGKPADCMAVVMQSAQWGLNPYSVAQKTHLVSGTLGYEAQLVNSVINAMAPTKDRLHFEWFGDWSRIIGNFVEKKGQSGKTYKAPGWTLKDEQGCGVKVWATLKGENEPRVLELLLTQALVRNSTLWASDPKQQLAYLAVKRWSRLYCPDVIMGVYTPDELQEIDMGPATIVEREPAPSKTEALKSRLAGDAKQAQGHGKGIDEILAAFDKAQTKADLDKIIPDAERLPAAQKKQARGAYAEKLQELKEAAAAAANARAGEQPTFAEISDYINISEKPSDVTDALDKAAGLPDDQLAELQALADDKLQQLEG